MAEVNFGTFEPTTGVFTFPDGSGNCDSTSLLCRNTSFLILYIVFGIIISLIALTMTASLLNTANNFVPMILHFINCVLFIVALIMFVYGKLMVASVLCAMELIIGFLSVTVIKNLYCTVKGDFTLFGWNASS